MVSVFATRLNCFAICAKKADDATLTLPISPPGRILIATTGNIDLARVLSKLCREQRNGLTGV
jgi:hypothetical protein